MKLRFAIGVRVALVLGAASALTNFAPAQSTNPNGAVDPYWGTAPEINRGPNIPVPGASANTISNAARSGSSDARRSLGGSSIGGGYMPPNLTANVIGLPSLRGKQGLSESRAHIWLHVPADAEVWMNGVKTRQSGESRYYYSPPLTPGQQYAYQMRVRWTKDGKPVDQTQRVFVSAGSTMRRDFMQPSSEDTSKK